uniref:Uncharacterized protein n=1 Tax=Meloidogyne enterolobii TaxID=390850 RepID=A0A6V7XGE0_MELEN|nr:unnamed protein product [Meloidogyne enterolobii]
MSKEFQQREKEKGEREKNESQQQQQTITSSSSFVEQQINFSTKMTTTTTPIIASENEESLITTTVINTSTTITGLQQPLNQILQHKKSLSNSNNSTSFSMISSRIDDEDPIFTLDEEVNAKEGERARHYTADFDPTISDDDEFPREMESLHGGRAYSASNRFPSRMRNTGRSGPLSNILHKVHGQFDSGGISVVPASLPIQISRGFNWPSHDLVGSLSEEEDGITKMEKARAAETLAAVLSNGINESEQKKETKILGQFDGSKLTQQNGSEQEETEIENLYGRIQAYSRSIQPEDDPERIFGERPHRRYSLAAKFGTDADLPPPSTEEEDSGGENIPPITTTDTLSSHRNPHQQQLTTITSTDNNQAMISNIMTPIASSHTVIPHQTMTIVGGGGMPNVIVPTSMSDCL